MLLFMRPMDTQFYRDGRPFEAGTENWAFSLFPPYPRTIYGAIRAAIWSQNPSAAVDSRWTDNGLVDVIGSPESFGTLAIRGPLVATYSAQNNQIGGVLFPAPRDLLKIRGSNKEYALIRPAEDVPSLEEWSDLDAPGLLPCLPDGRVSVEETENVVLHSAYLDRYLTGQAPIMNEEDEFVRREPRVGLVISRDTRSAATSFLYATAPVRMNDNRDQESGLLVEVECDGNLLPASGVMRLGGEGHAVVYRKVQPMGWKSHLNLVRSRVLATGRFKLYLITPAIFRGSWYPAFLETEGNALQGNMPGIELKVQLAGACVGRSIPIGGFDVFKRRPKDIRRAVPSGSVYFFRFTGWGSLSEPARQKHVDLLLDKFFFRTIADPGDVDCHWKEGFGTTLIGGW